MASDNFYITLEFHPIWALISNLATKNSSVAFRTHESFIVLIMDVCLQKQSS